MPDEPSASFAHFTHIYDVRELLALARDTTICRHRAGPRGRLGQTLRSNDGCCGLNAPSLELDISTPAAFECPALSLSFESAQYATSSAWALLGPRRWSTASASITRRAGIGYLPGADVSELLISNVAGKTVVPHPLVLRMSTEPQSKFGAHHVRIDRPQEFCGAATGRLIEFNFVERGWMNSVDYRARENHGAEPKPGYPGFIKPQRFAPERDFRIIWHARNPKHESFYILCPSARRYRTRPR
jgi:hypothetical protein